MKFINVDLDGVLANFNKRAEEIAGPNFTTELESPGWGVFAKHQHLYRDLELMPDARELWKHLSQYNVRILTAIPKRAHFPHAVDDKREWVYKHFGPNIRVAFGPFAKDKQYWCSVGDILIDDMKINCDQWEGRGGFAVQHKSTDDTIVELDKIFTNYISPLNLEILYFSKKGM